MTRYFEYPEEILAAASDEAVQALIDIEIAYARIIPIVAPKVPTVEDLGMVKNIQAYRVAGMLFLNREHADRCAELDIYREDYSCAAGYDHRFLKKVESVSVESIMFYDEDDVNRLAPQIKAQGKRKQEYDNKLNYYNTYLRKVGELRDAVWSKVNAARRNQERIQEAKDTLARYSRLAGGDEEVAKEFFKETYKDHPIILQAVLGIGYGEKCPFCDERGEMVVEPGIKGTCKNCFGKGYLPGEAT